MIPGEPRGGSGDVRDTPVAQVCGVASPPPPRACSKINNEGTDTVADDDGQGVGSRRADISTWFHQGPGGIAVVAVGLLTVIVLLLMLAGVL